MKTNSISKFSIHVLIFVMYFILAALTTRLVYLNLGDLTEDTGLTFFLAGLINSLVLFLTYWVFRKKIQWKDLWYAALIIQLLLLVYGYFVNPNNFHTVILPYFLLNVFFFCVFYLFFLKKFYWGLGFSVACIFFGLFVYSFIGQEFHKKSKEPNIKLISENWSTLDEKVLLNLDGSPFDSDLLDGKICVVNFWFHGCYGARTKFKTIGKIQSQFADIEEVVFLNVYSADYPFNETALNFLKDSKTKFSAIQLIDTGGDLRNKIKIGGTPVDIILNKNHEIVWVYGGFDGTQSRHYRKTMIKKINSML